MAAITFLISILGLLQISSGLLERQLQRRKLAALGPLQPLPTDLGVTPSQGISPSDPRFPRAEFEHLLATKFMPVNLDIPGTRVHHFDPPILTFESLLASDECDQIITDVEASGTLAPSQIGANTVGTDANTYSSRRTSETALLDAKLCQAHPSLGPHRSRLHEVSRQILHEGLWSPPGQLPPSGYFCFELLQVTRYVAGQQFMAHEDGFPDDGVRENRFQRRATVLFYLNDVPVAEGGATKFVELEGIALQPRRGTVALFFPATTTGVSDSRTLHAAAPAEKKWVAQQWVAWGTNAVGSEAQAQAERGGGRRTTAAGALGDQAALHALFGADATTSVLGANDKNTSSSRGKPSHPGGGNRKRGKGGGKKSGGGFGQ